MVVQDPAPTSVGLLLGPMELNCSPGLVVVESGKVLSGHAHPHENWC